MTIRIGTKWINDNRFIYWSVVAIIAYSAGVIGAIYTLPRDASFDPARPAVLASPAYVPGGTKCRAGQPKNFALLDFCLQAQEEQRRQQWTIYATMKQIEANQRQTRTTIFTAYLTTVSIGLAVLGGVMGWLKDTPKPLPRLLFLPQPRKKNKR